MIKVRLELKLKKCSRIFYPTKLFLSFTHVLKVSKRQKAFKIFQFDKQIWKIVIFDVEMMFDGDD